MKARIAFEDGFILTGRSLGATGTTGGEAVFNTSMVGYQEVLTDPSYAGQIVTMTYPLIGNYGVNEEDAESRGLFLSGFVVKEASPIVSNWRSNRLTLHQYLQANRIVAIEGVDTRALTRHIRDAGAMNAVISSESDPADTDLVRLAAESEHMAGRDYVKDVILDESYTWQNEGKYHVVVYDCGVKYNILRELARAGCRVTTVPATFSAADILALAPDGVMLSNGPGDPAAVDYAIETTKGLIGRVPLFGICLGHQMLCLALGGTTYKLKFGHHGANHPVKDMATDRVMITVQNHGFCVDLDSLGGDRNVEITHLNLNDQTCEGINHRHVPAFSVQFHPEAAAGPHDAKYMFGRFREMMEKNKGV
ncbi:MAG: glutamine-hydrolyzing carbamoyl-phosphate synthase small subunit [Sedimentisphaerales bacterium]|nr:glutamine-hydrolyzing carbamoyl-phosphate synthase small subunit [Sedimentisphaerales bacterium]